MDNKELKEKLLTAYEIICELDELVEEFNPEYYSKSGFICGVGDFIKELEDLLNNK